MLIKEWYTVVYTTGSEAAVSKSVFSKILTVQAAEHRMIVLNAPSERAQTRSPTVRFLTSMLTAVTTPAQLKPISLSGNFPKAVMTSRKFSPAALI